MAELIPECTVRYEMELEASDIMPPSEAVPRAICECMARVLLDKNGIVLLALVDRRKLDPLSLNPVTEEDEALCINTLWETHSEVFKSLKP